MTDAAVDCFSPAALQSVKPKRKTPVQTTKLSLAHMRKQGCVAAVVERWNAHAKVKNDLFGIIDVLCLAPDGTTIGVQCTSRAHVADRVAKIGDSEHIVALRRCNWKLVVHGWDKHGARWRLREVDVS